MTNYFIAAILFIGVAYGCVEAWPLLAGPSLSVAFPADNVVVPDGIVNVAGKVSRVAALTMNGAPVLYDQEGAFASTLTFPHGGSILTFEATDRFGKTVHTSRSIFVP